MILEEINWTAYRSCVPEAERGHWRIEQFEVPKEEVGLTMLRYGHRAPRPGRYTRLVYRNMDTVMSDTPAELRDLLPLKRHSRGHVLIHGLGLGVAADLCRQMKAVDHVTVVEVDPDVIALVHPTIQHPKLTVIQADALTWSPPNGMRYDAVWHDIWPSLCSDHLADMHRLHRRYARRAAWQGSWCRAEMEYARDRQSTWR